MTHENDSSSGAMNAVTATPNLMKSDAREGNEHDTILDDATAWPEECVVMTNPMNGTGPVFHHHRDVRKAIDAAMSLPSTIKEQPEKASPPLLDNGEQKGDLGEPGDSL